MTVSTESHGFITENCEDVGTLEDFRRIIKKFALKSIDHVLRLTCLVHKISFEPVFVQKFILDYYNPKTSAIRKTINSEDF